MLLLFLGLGGQVVADCATGYRTRDGMVSGEMPGYPACHGALDATRRHARLAEAEQQGGQGDGSKTFHERDLGLDGEPRVRGAGLTSA